MCCGRDVELDELRTTEQKDIFKDIGAFLDKAWDRSASGFPGLLNAPINPLQMNAADLMNRMSGYGKAGDLADPNNPYFYLPSSPVPGIGEERFRHGGGTGPPSKPGPGDEGPIIGGQSQGTNPWLPQNWR